MSTGNDFIEARRVMKEYGGETVLAGCSLALAPGDFTCVTGPSGAGKSTMLSIMGLLMEPDGGTVVASGRDCLDMGDSELSELRSRLFGFVFQHNQLVGSLRAFDNVVVPACFAGNDREQAEARARELVERFGLGSRANHFPHQLSVGQKRRVALVRALVLQPSVIVADEPTNDLDAESAEIVMEALTHHAESGGAVICATHDGKLAARAKTVLRLHDGLLEEGNDARD